MRERGLTGGREIMRDCGGVLKGSFFFFVWESVEGEGLKVCLFFFCFC